MNNLSTYSNDTTARTCLSCANQRAFNLDTRTGRRNQAAHAQAPSTRLDLQDLKTWLRNKKLLLTKKRKLVDNNK